MLDQVERRTVVGRRDYAMLLLMVTYGLRAREVAALTLDDIDRKRDRLHVRERKADHTTAYPLAPVIGEAIIDYLKNGRPKCAEPGTLLASPCAAIADDSSGSIERCQQVSAQGGHPRITAGISYVAARLRPALGGLRLSAQDRRRLRRASVPIVDNGLCKDPSRRTP
jgi:integrase